MPIRRSITPLIVVGTMTVSAPAQVLEVDASRTISLEVEGATPIQRSTFGFGLLDDDERADGVPNGGRTAGAVSQRSTIGSASYTGELAAHAESVLEPSFASADASATTSCVVLFEVTQPVDVTSRIELNASALNGGTPRAFVLLGNPDDEGLFLDLSLDTPTDQPLIDDRTFQLPPGLYALNARVSAATSLQDRPGDETADARCSFNLRIRPTSACDCERAGDPAVVDVLDLLEYVDDWLHRDTTADVNRDDDISVVDLLLFLECWLDASMGACLG